MPDKLTEAMLEGLRRAMADPHPTPLHAQKAQPGLFPNSSTGRSAAQRCKDEGLLQVVDAEQRGKSSREHCRITDEGVEFLLQETNPRQLLKDFVRAMEARETEVEELRDRAQRLQQCLEQTRGHVEALLPRLSSNGTNSHVGGAASESLRGRFLAALEQWHSQEGARDCPLPELFFNAKHAFPTITIGQFHDELRRMHENRLVYLHPWTGPMHELPEPALALLVGHEIAYYASARDAQRSVIRDQQGSSTVH